MTNKHRSHLLSLLLLVLFIGITTASFGQTPFVTVWQTDNIGPRNETDSNQIRFPATGDFSYSWVDVNNTSSTDSGIGTGPTTITFPQAGTYELSVTPRDSTPFNRISFCEYCRGDQEKLIEIKNWGAIQWTEFQFNGCYNLKISATDTPDLSNVSDMAFVFSHSGVDTIPNVNDWDISNVTDLSNSFAYTKFNQPLDNWDVSNVTDMSFMFDGDSVFNQPLDTWNMSKVQFIAYMFRDASSFDQSLATWDLDSLKSALAWLIRTNMSCENYSYTLYGWANNPRTNSGVFYGAYNVEYSSAVIDARDYLIDSLNWDFQSGDNLGTCNIALSVDFTNFTARQDNSRALLNWQTASESNNRGFDIQRSNNGIEWETIGFIPSKSSKGKNSQRMSYHFYDNHPLIGANYYRLKQNDFDGRYSYSDIRQLAFTAPESVLQLYPNPAGDYITVSGLQAIQSIQLYDLRGSNLPIRVNNNNDKTEIDLKGIAPGVYYLKVISAKGPVLRQKLIKL